MNYQVKLNLLKLDRATVTNIKGKSQTLKCLVVPIGDGTDIVHGEKGAYLDLVAFETANSQFGDTHCVKVSYPKERRDAMTDEEKRSKPFVGNMRPLEAKQPQVTSVAEAEQPDDLPF